ncbi:hypothetical protein Tco_0150420 [Tanacetum coccineum]
MTSVRSMASLYWLFRRKGIYINKHSEFSDRVLKQSESGSQMRNSQCGSLASIEKYGLKLPNLLFFKEDYTIVPKLRTVVYRDRNDQRKLMRLNELHKFSDETLTRVMEKMGHMVKDFHLFEYNKGRETRKWSEDDKRRSKDFITAIEKRLQIRRIFRSLESFVAVSSSLRLLEPKRTIESRAKRSSINLVRTQHPSETMVFHNEDGNPARANIKQALGRPHKGVKASANSDIVYFFTSAQDGDPLQDDVRLCLGDDLKKAQDHNQRQV